MLITSSNSWNSGIRKRTVKSEVRLGPVTLKFVTIALLAVAALFYLAQSSRATAQKYNVSNLQNEVQQNQNDVDQLKVEAARLQSLNAIKEAAASQNMVESN